jgi:glycine cleavage system H protein
LKKGEGGLKKQGGTMNIPDDLKYSKEHEWAKDENGIVLVGITDYAQGELGDIVFIDLPEPGKTVAQNDSFGTIEAVKAASDIYCPVSGEIIEVNHALTDAPEVINQDPYGQGWMIKVKPADLEELDMLMDAGAYKSFIAQ